MRVLVENPGPRDLSVADVTGAAPVTSAIR
jgi:hypothetical protein